MSMDAVRTPKPAPPALAAGLSLLVPGLGQAVTGRRARGVSLLLTVVLMLLLAWWSKQPAWFVLPALVWAWNVWDAAASAAPPSAALPILAAAVLFYGLGWKATEINLPALAHNFGRAYQQILVPMMQPDFVERRSEVRQAWVALQVPCSETPPAGTNTVDGMQLTLSAGCAKVGDEVTVTGSGLWPNVDAGLVWQSPIGDFFPLRDSSGRTLTAPVDAQGNVTAAVKVPLAVPPGVDASLPQAQRLYLQQKRPLSGYQLSTNGRFVVQGIYETLALALMATTLGTLLAIPISFLAARNLMSANPVTLAIYVAVRTALNIVRSIESLIIAIVFVVVVGLGPFAGMLALAVHTVAALAKLYSEVIEGIDAGPIEAMRATGANWLQVVRYGVVPQIVPPFTAFTIYRWDINVRSSVIIGFVGGGGIGFFLVQWVNLSDFRAVSTCFIAILLVIALMDQLSARIRERLI